MLLESNNILCAMHTGMVYWYVHQKWKNHTVDVVYNHNKLNRKLIDILICVCCYYYYGGRRNYCLLLYVVVVVGAFFFLLCEKITLRYSVNSECRYSVVCLIHLCSIDLRKLMDRNEETNLDIQYRDKNTYSVNETQLFLLLLTNKNNWYR